jgi:uncharacterized membrane protein YkoI
MQNEETSMDEMDEKAVVRVDGDGNAIKCAKGLTQGCGYKAGAKVCGKCGAMAVQSKGGAYEMAEDEEEMEEESDEEEMPTERRKASSKGMDEAEDYEGMGEEMPMKKKPKKAVRMANPDELDEYDEEDPSAEEMDESDDMPDESNGEMGETVVEAMGDEDRKRRMAARKRRMASMNIKSAQWGDDAYLCGFQGKMLSGDAQPCASCPGGCAPEADLPTLIEVQGLAEEMFEGAKVLDSGYSDATDLFVVDVMRKDGRVAEAIFDGSTAECIGWSLLDDELIGEKSANQPYDIVSLDDAARIATKTLPGEVVSIDADVFEGHDVYAVEIEGVDGKSYDGFVSLNGELLGYDEYDADEASLIDAETAEYALKAMYTEGQRAEMAEEGNALPDGSYPIGNVEDLRNAIQAFGRAKDKEAAKRHIMKRARQLNALDLVPEAWMSDSKSDEDEFLVNLMEFELLSTEQDLEKDA